MALPFILGAAALAAAGYGAKKGYDGYQDQSLADDINKDTESRYESAKSAYDARNEATNQKLESLGALQLKIGSDFGEFDKIAVALLEKLNHSHNSRDLTIHIPQHRLDAIKRFELSATTYLSQVMGAGVGGAAAAYAVYGGVMAFAAASTGTSIAALSGVAATNATLAAIGGGSLAAGGLGMAGGTAILGGVVAAPVLAIAGWAYASHAEKALDNARENRSKANQAIEKMAYCSEKLLETIKYAERIQDAINRIYKVFYRYFDQLKSINHFIKMGGDIQEKADETIMVIENGYKLAAILTDIITTPLFKPQTNNAGQAVVDANQTVELAKDEHGMPILNKEKIDNTIQQSWKNLIDDPDLNGALA